jgi:hypothetical protein
MTFTAFVAVKAINITASTGVKNANLMAVNFGK